MQCEHTLKQTGGGNKETSTEEYYSISHQILRINSTKCVADCKEYFCQNQRSERVNWGALCGLSSGKNCFVVKLDPHFHLQNDQN